LVVAALLTGTGVSVWQAIDATLARDLADKRFKEADNLREVAEKERKKSDRLRNEAEFERGRFQKSAERERRIVTDLLVRLGSREIAAIPGMRAVYAELRRQALTVYEELIAANPRDARTLADKGDLHFLYRHDDKERQMSLDCFEKAAEIEPARHTPRQ
jgi:hypothetical protein